MEKKPVNILIVEDVTLVAKRIESLCKRIFDCNQCDLAFDLDTAKQNLAQQDYDLVFLDLNVNGVNGFDLLSLESVYPASVVVVTAHQDQAVNAYELAIFDFISKPITEARFAAVARRFLKSRPADSEFLFLKKGNAHYKIPVSQINYLKASGNYTEVFTLEGEVHLFDQGISYFETHFPRFVRCHRSYLTKPENVQSIIKLGAGQYRLNLLNSVQIPMSRPYYESHFRDWGK